MSRVAANIATIAFSQGQQISDADAERAAENAEQKAYTVARVEAQTTTGVRPHSETYEAYTRCTQYSRVINSVWILSHTHQHRPAAGSLQP